MCLELAAFASSKLADQKPMSATRLGAPSPQNLSDPNKRSGKVKVTASDSKSDSHLFGTPLISSTYRSNSLSRLTGNFVERIGNQKRDKCL